MVELVQCKKFHFGPLAKGCQQCVLGRKTVIFVTGICHYNCFYCPISDDKRMKDIVKVNEHVVINPDSDEGVAQIIKEIKLCQSTGASLTGGDPLAKLDRTINYIRAIKDYFGDKFHIHLYSSLPFVTQEALIKLADAGLDEIRFHPDIDDIASWEKILFAEGLGMTVGIEIPSIPGKADKMKELVYFAKATGFVEFININELEYSDISESNFSKHGFVVKDNLSYGILGSEATAKDVVKYSESIGFPAHYCSAGFKDNVQLANRMRLRSETVAKEYDVVDEEGMLTRGEIRIVDDSSSVDLERIKQDLEDDFEIPANLIEIDSNSNRLLIAPWLIEELVNALREVKSSESEDEFPYQWFDAVEFSIVREYPTDDNFLLERTTL